MNDPKRTRAAQFALVLIGIAVLALAFAWFLGARSGDEPSPTVIADLDAWVERTQQDGFTLLDAADLPDYFLSVYDTGRDEIAVAYRWKHTTDKPSTHGLDLRDADGQVLHDRGRSTDPTTLNEDGTSAADYVDGFVIPIPEAYRGPIKIELRDDHDTSLPDRSVYAETITR